VTTIESPPLPRRPHIRPGTPLTDRELQVLDLASRGLTDEAIGRTLYVTLNTVKVHMRALLVRLSARNRTHAVRLGFQLGLLTADEVTS
jgi:DNA-binding NarL/FixJ family response regulator